MYIKENFCPVCVLPVIAAVGGGAAAGGVLTSEEKNKRTKKILIWTGVSVILSVIFIYIWLKSKKCKTCKL